MVASDYRIYGRFKMLAKEFQRIRKWLVYATQAVPPPKEIVVSDAIVVSRPFL